MKNIKYIILFFTTISFTFQSCSDWLDINNDPNNPTTGQLSQLLPSAQTQMAFSFSRTVNENTMIFSNMIYSLSQSQYTQNPTTYNNDFKGLFHNALPDIEVIIEDGTADKNLGYVGVAQIMKALIYAYSVDLWGDLPFTEAQQGADNLTPMPDDDAFIYDQLLILLDEAITNLEADAPAIENDLFYNGNKSLWIKAANSIKLRLLLNLRLIDEGRARIGIQALAADPSQLISSNAESFVFPYGSSSNPENRHPLFQREYTAVNKNFYMSQYFMFKLLDKRDPRLNYYIYRQDNGGSLDFQTTPCSQRSDCPIGYLGLIDPAWSGYIGRDHGDPSGLPGDNAIRSTFGVYPIGGEYDAGAAQPISAARIGANAGAGIAPILTYSQVNFMLAEAALLLGTDGSPDELLAAGINASFDQVEAFAQSIVSSYPAIADSIRNDYVDRMVGRFNGASAEVSKLNVLIEEKYFSQFCNGIDVFTDLRRTGMPNDLPASMAPAAPFPVRLPYSQQELNSNPNIQAIAQDMPVFWDVN